MEKKDKTSKQVESLAVRFKNYKDGKSEIPKLQTEMKLLKSDDAFVATLTKEIIDRDGEIVSVDGMEIEDAKNGIPLLDAHNQRGSVVDNVLGRVKEICKIDGDIKEIKGIITFADTIKGREAKMLVEGGFVDSVSIGFGVKEFDTATNTIKEGVLYECSLVSIPANRLAKITLNKNLKNEGEIIKDLEKKIKRFDEIYPAFREFTKTFFSDTFTKSIDFKNSDNLVLDINSMYDVIIEKLQSVEAPQKEVKNKVEAPQYKEIKGEELDRLINSIIS